MINLILENNFYESCLSNLICFNKDWNYRCTVRMKRQSKKMSKVIFLENSCQRREFLFTFLQMFAINSNFSANTYLKIKDSCLTD